MSPMTSQDPFPAEIASESAVSDPTPAEHMINDAKSDQTVSTSDAACSSLLGNADSESDGGSSHYRDQLAQFMDTLQSFKVEAKELAKLHYQVKHGAAGRLPPMGSLMDAEEDFLEALDRLKHVSPLLLVDGAAGSGKSTLINALLLSSDLEASCETTGSSSVGLGSGAGECTEAGAVWCRAPLVKHCPLYTGPKNSVCAKTIIVRMPTRTSTCRRFLEGKPSFSTNAEAEMQELSQSEWTNKLSGQADIRNHQQCLQPSSKAERESKEGTSLEGPQGSLKEFPETCQRNEGQVLSAGTCSANENMPLILEDHRSVAAFGSCLWIAEVKLEEGKHTNSNWVNKCTHVVCVVRAFPSGNIVSEDDARVRSLLQDGRDVFVVVNIQTSGQETPQALPPDVTEKLKNDGVCGMMVTSLHHFSQQPPQADDGEHAPKVLCDQTWFPCVSEFQAFASRAQQERLLKAKSDLTAARGAFVQWCSQGTKVLAAVSSRLQQDADIVRMARNIITTHIDAAYLAHFFSSVLVGKFDSMCTVLKQLPAPDLQGRWGRHATRRVMEEHMRTQVEHLLCIAMQESLQEVTLEMARQEQPALDEIRRVAANSNAGVPWDADVKALELSMHHEHLQHFALHFFGSLGVGVLSGLGAAAVETLLGELVFGPVGLVVGVATFVAIGVSPSDWQTVRDECVKRMHSQQLELISHAREKLDFPELCERRKRRILEQMDLILERQLREIAVITESATDFAHSAVALQARVY